MNLADRYQQLKAQEAEIAAQLKVVLAEVNEQLDAGEEVVTSDGTRYIRQVAEQRTYKVTGLGGILALLRNNTALDAAHFLTVKAAAVKSLAPELQEGLAFTTKDIVKVVVGK